MHINSIKIKNFRCFNNNNFNFDNKFILLQGANGAGKTTILEAIYYTCYLKSFRTRLNKELFNFESEHFFLQVDFQEDNGDKNSITTGFSVDEGKLVKFNQKLINSYKDIISRFKIISITEDDLLLINGSPEFRRAYLDQSLFLVDFNFLQNLRKYKQILQNRNGFLLKNSPLLLLGQKRSELLIWTKQLWEQAFLLQSARIDFLVNVQKEVNNLLKKYFDLEFFNQNNNGIRLDYSSKNLNLSLDFESFWDFYLKNLLEKECKFGRSFFGIHLDDFIISLNSKKSRMFASRGQQKLVLFLLKIVQLQLLQKDNEKGVLLLDDFLTDFDEEKLSCCLNLLKNMENQVFLTSPIRSFLDCKTPLINDLQVIKI
ncbi:DNA replication and repair protein RecF [Candidatus Babeliales bacterium]|nr:DNA replication and repair protein RecF [Candidatus Babeliales bacterium]MCF7899113.1 DNA replication and repair protein RecF [Candidatus Babeliales bacterium]